MAPPSPASTRAAINDPAALLDTLGDDPIEFLNRHYLTEASLAAHLPFLREAVTARQEAAEDRISSALQRQAETAEATRRHVQHAKASVAALEHRIRQVQEKAGQSEKAVLEITKDIKRLDCAKKHLQRTITTLKRLHMLVRAVDQLRTTCTMKPFPDYKTASNLVDATRLLLMHFEAYSHKVEPMRVLSQKVIKYQDQLKAGFVRGTRVVAFGCDKTDKLESLKAKKAAEEPHDKDHPEMSVEVMKGGALFIDALGEANRAQFIHNFCQDYLGEYLKDFEPPSQEKKQEKRVSSFKVVEAKEPEKSPAGLDMIEKRFTWFRRVLEDVDSKFPRVFPSQWNIQAHMAQIFLELTRDHILALLDGPRKDPDAANATLLLKALQKTLLFEKDITVWLQREFGTEFEGLEKSEDQKKGKIDEFTTTPMKPLLGVASVAFENYMDPYVRLEEQSMDEQLVEALEDKTVDTRGERPVYISSTNLFVYIKGSITRCTALTKGKGFYLLHTAFKNALRKYAQILDGKLPTPVIHSGPVVGGLSIAGSFGGKLDGQQSATYRLALGEEVAVCHIISTCEYCADTMEALEDLIRDTIVEPYKSKIDMVSDQDIFHETTAKAIRVLVSGLVNRADTALKVMSTTNWGAWEAVGEESEYVQLINETVQPFVRTIRSLLPTSYFRSFCDKFAAAFTSVYFESMTKLKRISEPGTQQLLLDVYNIKTLFLKLPVLEESNGRGGKPGSGGSTIAPAVYTKIVNKQFERIETTLKLVGTPNEMVIENFKVQWAGGTAHDLQVVLALKGMKRAEQASMLEKFGLDPVSAIKGATVGVTSAVLVSERVQALQDQGSTVAAKVNSDLNQMRQKVDDFRKSFR